MLHRTTAVAIVLCAAVLGCGRPTPLTSPTGASVAPNGDASPLTALHADKIELDDLGKLTPMMRFNDVERRLGHGAPSEGHVTLYRSEDTKADYWFWYLPVDMTAKNAWSDENLGLCVVTLGRDGPVLWPEALKGHDLESVFAIYAKEHPAE